MAESLKAVHVKDLLHKAADPSVQKAGVAAENAQAEHPKLKLLSIRGSEAPCASNWLHDEMVEKISAHQPELEVANYDLSLMRITPCKGCYGGGGRQCILPCDRNDIDSDIYDPKDEMIKLYDSIQDCDLMLLSTDMRGGQLPSFTAKFIERLNPFNVLLSKGRGVLRNKVATLVTVGQSSAGSAEVERSLNHIGFEIPRHGSLHWNLDDLDTREYTQTVFKKDVPLHQELEQVAANLVAAALSLKA